ncbi:hypothetical protein E0E57_12045 [Enterococcus faecium]|nr:hypothetical protein [Enterococcus faecium]PJO83911.1 hypothetical protein CWI29_10325 [Enterococcus faecium]PWO39422.1 hypothetical protein DKT67_03975 [Enterococcus faecium]RXA59865.1 hypothetical protein EQ862_10550 [Enterococcus faecium]RXA82734.1 hypothetical protein EQ865_10785 [Enterococcus faecium]
MPFHFGSQGTISKNSFSCLLNIVTCDRGVGRRIPFTGEFVTCHNFFSSTQNESVLLVRTSCCSV